MGELKSIIKNWFAACGIPAPTDSQYQALEISIREAWECDSILTLPDKRKILDESCLPYDPQLAAVINRTEREVINCFRLAYEADLALAEMVHAMFRSGNRVPVTRITIDRKQYEAAIDSSSKEPGQ